MSREVVRTRFQREFAPECPKCGETDTDFWEVVDNAVHEECMSVECPHCGFEYEYSFEVFKYVTTYRFEESDDEGVEG